MTWIFASIESDIYIYNLNNKQKDTLNFINIFLQNWEMY